MDNALLSTIDDPEDLRKLDSAQLVVVAKELRDFVIGILATKEGHLGASLGVVELTIALHYCFDTPNDLLIWDVGHQAYPHKILTGRKNNFHTLRQYGGISGFPKRSESIHDAFGTGHSSTSIAAALGMAIASKLSGATQRHHIAVIGDASIASGMAFESLNHAGVTDTNLLIILNDNAIGIDPSVGALKKYLTTTKSDKTPTQDNIFEALNFNYFGPVDGHNLPLLLKTLEKLKNTRGPKLLHVLTTKGKGLRQAEENQVVYHAPGKFDANTGELAPKAPHTLTKFQDVFGLTLLELARENPKIVGITPAMPTGSALKYMMDALPERAFDVGIAEQHAVTLCAGMAAQGLLPFCTIYATFLQRAYDQIIHDVALQKLPVVFCIDRAGLVGADGPTHHGVFDIAALQCIPNMIIAAPKDEIALRNLLYTASLGLENPIAIRYPRGYGQLSEWKKPFQKVGIGKGSCLKTGSKIALISVGSLAHPVRQAIDKLAAPELIAHYDLGFIKPIDTDLLHQICSSFAGVITAEDGVAIGGVGHTIGAFIAENHYPCRLQILGIPDQFVSHGATEALREACGISATKIQQALERMIAKISL